MTGNAMNTETLENMPFDNGDSVMTVERERVNIPPSPKTVLATGLSPSFISDLIIKHIYRYGTICGYEIAEKICLPFPVIDRILDEILENNLAEKRGSRGLGNSTDLFSLVEKGRNYAQDLLELDTYTGPAPVTLEQYTKHIQETNLKGITVREAMLRDAWKDIILDESFYPVLGPAIRSGTSCFLYGPPGTGKTVLAKSIARYLEYWCGYIAIPYAIIVGGSIIRVYDPVYHEQVQNTKSYGDRFLLTENQDRRWLICKRPSVISAGELTLDMLDLRYNPITKYYEAPLHLKSNGGIFIIDDFGRQQIDPRNLLNRWILPLEERIDFLTLHTGKKFPIPFEQFVIFATNLNPKQLVDEAFLRRIRYKIYVGQITVNTYKLIFDWECRKKNLVYNSVDLDTIIEKYYLKPNRMLRACDPRDITDRIVDYCHYYELPLKISYEIFDNTYAAYMATVVT
ncbi:MAG TPA: AAA family ATPase [bacterium]|nr:AAA family ATPase [bacterium]